jgi:amidase
MTAASDIVMMDAVQLGAAIHARQVSCVEVMDAYLAQIERLNPAHNAIVALQDREGLLRQAGERDAQLSHGESMGPLHGFPLAVKDLQATRGIVTAQGSPIFRDFVPDADSLVVERLRGAGGIVIGKTNTPEFGLGSHTYNPVYGVTRNAWDPARSAGGSSGGAAVALALRMAPVADGSDYGGSLRNPSGWNNVLGFRTSLGRVPNTAREDWLPSMGVSGPMARNVGDLALLLSVMAGFDARAPLSLDGDGGEFRDVRERDPRGLRIGWLGDFAGAAPCGPGVLEACETALKRFEDLGCVVETALPDYAPDAAWAAFKTVRSWQAGGALLEHYQDPARRALMKPEAVFEVESELKLTAYDVTAASLVRSEWSQAVRRLLERYDYLIAPTAQVFPFAAGETWPRQIAGQAMDTYHAWMKGVCLVSLSGCPSLAVPAGFGAQGLPMGIQIIAPVQRELACLELALAYERAAGWGSQLPPALAALAAS